jgi:SAM-dependent methyltransferase
LDETSNPAVIRPYIFLSLERLAKLADIRGRQVLEIGGGLPRDLVLDKLGASAWVCVDDRSGWSRSMGHSVAAGTSITELRPEQIESGWSSFDSSAHDIPSWVDGQFDFVISFAALEHIPCVPKLMRRVRALLRPGGAAWFLVGPIWSGYRGYHIYPRDFLGYEGETSDFLQKITPWQHLLMSPVEFYDWARHLWGEGFADALQASIFESTRINRLGLADYQLAFQLSGLCTAHYQEWPSPADSDAQLEAVRARYPYQRGFEVDGFSILLRNEPQTPETAEPADPPASSS